MKIELSDDKVDLISQTISNELESNEEWIRVNKLEQEERKAWEETNNDLRFILSALKGGK